MDQLNSEIHKNLYSTNIDETTVLASKNDRIIQMKMLTFQNCFLLILKGYGDEVSYGRR